MLLIDSATLPAPPCVRGRATVDPARVRRHFAASWPGRHRDDHAVAVRFVHLGYFCAGMGETERKNHVLGRCE